MMALLNRHPSGPEAPGVPAVDPAFQPIDLEGLLEGVHGVISLCEVPEKEIEGGRRAICLPEGALELSDHAFETYNQNSDTVRCVRDIRCSNYRALELEKQIVQKRIPARRFPKELKNVKEKRDYMLRQEEKERLMRLSLPVSLTVIHRYSFPVLLDSIEVPGDHPTFRSIDGVLFSRDGKTLLRYPGLQADRADYVIPEGVEQVAPGAFEDSILDSLTIPGSLHTLTLDSFAGIHAKSVTVSEGVEVIATGSFSACYIEHLTLPTSLERIEQEAFRRASGFQSLEHLGGEVELGPSLFRESQLDDVNWWAWSYIPKGTFLNSRLRKITIPEGVEDIGPYAFAGCFSAKSVQLAQSVRTVAPFSFDLGPTYNRPITLPEHLFSAICRFPARSPVNKRGKERMLRQFEETGQTERRDILERQLQSLEGMPPLQKKLYPSLRQEMAFYQRQLDRCQDA